MESKGLSSFKSVEILLKVAILPMYTKSPMDAVKQQLNSTLFKFNEEMQGIPLSFSEIEFPVGKEYGRIMNDQPWVHVDVLTKLVVFVPTVGAHMEGKINKVSDNHVSILVLSMFNASLSMEEVSKRYKFSATSHSWLSAHGDLNEGDNIVFKVVSFQHSNGVLHIEGALV